MYSPAARRAIARLLDAHRPDVAHLHNVYHQLTLSIVDELASRGIPIVLTMHDWKIACPAYTLFTEGDVCRRCPTGNVASAVRHRCVKSSVAASVIAATEAIIAQRRGSYEKVQRFIAPSRFAIGVAALAGVSEAKVAHIPNFLPDDELNVTARDDDAGAQFLYAGRLEETKGIRGLLAAFARVSTPARCESPGVVSWRRRSAPPQPPTRGSRISACCRGTSCMRRSTRPAPSSSRRCMRTTAR